MSKKDTISIKEHLHGKILLRTARIKMQLGDNDNALNDLEYANSIFEKHKIQSDLSTSFILSGLYYYDQGDLEKAEKYYRKSLRIKKIINDLSGIAACYMNLGSIYKRIKKYEKAMKIYNMAYNIYTDLNENIKAEDILLNLNNLYSQKGLYKKIIKTEYLEKILKKGKRDIPLINFYQTLSNAYYHLGNENKAYNILKKGITKTKRLGLIDYYANLLMRKGVFLYYSGKKIECIKQCKTALEAINKYEGNNRLKIILNYNIASTSVELNRNNEAFIYYKNVLDLDINKTDMFKEAKIFINKFTKEKK